MRIERPAVNSKSIAVSPNGNIHLNSVYDKQITSIPYFPMYMSCTRSRNNNLTPWSLVGLENLTAGWLVKKSSALLGPPKVHYQSPL